MTKTKAESLWDWCLTEVMKLPNGQDVWEQITKVKDFSRQSVLEEVREKMPKKLEDQGKYCGCDGECFGNCNRSFNNCHDQVTSLINNLIEER